MRSESTYLTILFCSLTIFSWLVLTEAYPVDDEIEKSLGFSSNEVSKDDGRVESKETTNRPKRTIGFLRQLFPGISQIIDRKIQAITRVLFRVVGRLILRGGNRSGGNGGGDGSDGSGGRRISITLPTYPPVDDEDETETPTEQPASDSLPDIRFGSGDRNATSDSQPAASNTSLSNSADTPGSTDAPESNTIVRKVREVGDASETTVAFDDESSSSETSTKRQGLLQRLGNEMRKKRGSLGSGGGSGNFLFDLIRLVAGSGVPPEKDEELNAPRDERDEGSVDGVDNADPTAPGDNSEDNYSAGIPGPLTRLFVLANRGLANLIQDLILLCPDQTFKCKLHSSEIVNNVANDIHSS